MVFAYSLIAIKQTIIGINKSTVNEERLRDELNNTPEILAEAVQTILRKNGFENAYEVLKGLTRGKNIALKEIREFVNNLDINKTDRETLLNLTPERYIGLAEELAKKV